MNFRIFQPRSLKTKITFFTLAVFLISIWSLALYVSKVLRDDMQRLLGEQQFSIASILAAEVDQQLSDRLSALESVAANITPEMLGNPSAMQALLEQRPVLQGLFNAGTFTTGLDGIATGSVPLAAGRFGVNYSDRDYIQAALQQGKSTIGKPVKSKVFDSVVFAFGVPIRDGQGRIMGALAGVVDLAKPNFLDRIAQGRYGQSGIYLVAAPQHGVFVTSSDKSRILRPLPAPGANPLHDKHANGFEGYGSLVNFRGEEELTAAKGIPVAGWFMGVALPAKEAFAPIRTVEQRMLLAALLLTVLAGGLTWWMLKRQFSPMLVAAKALLEISGTSRSVQPLPVTSDDEIGELIGGFNRLQETAVQREALLRQILDTSSVAIFLVSMEGRITQANLRMAEMFGWNPDSLEGQEYVALVHPREREIGREKMLALLGSDIASVDLDRLYWRADQSEFWGHLTGKSFYDVNGKKLGLIGVIADITERRNADEKLRESERKLFEILENVDAYIYLKDMEGRYLFANRPVRTLFGASMEQVVGQSDEKFFDTKTALQIRHNDRQVLDKGETLRTEETNVNLKSGGSSTYLSVKLPLRNTAGEIYALCGISTDITTIKDHEKQLEYFAHFDMLTSLPNRVFLADRLHQAMAQAHRRGQRLAVAYLDLDAFKAVNDSHGHEAGDQLLISVSEHMKQALREGDTLARIGGDEFVAVLVDLHDNAAGDAMLSRLLAAAAQPVPFGNHVLQVSASLGVTYYPQADEVDADQLMRQADQAMYQAKVAGKNRCHVFDAVQDLSVRGHHESVERIRTALTQREFVLYFQPKVNLRTGAVIGAEALIRWQHPQRGLLSPALFLPLIEDHPLAVDLGEWVIDSALTHMAHWHEQGLVIPASVNIGARQLQQVDFAERLSVILARHPHVRPDNLELEVLETSALQDLAHVSRLIESCRQIGVMFALDDFGTGYSSLTYLKRLQVFQLKIDQSFVRDMLEDPDDLAILEGVIGLAAAFRRQVIAEGVETVEHGAMLLQLGCELAQGYGIARPMPASDLVAWAAQWRPDPAWAEVSLLKRDDLPLLFARVEHRAWSNGVESYLRGERALAPPLDRQQSHFGRWLGTEGVARHGQQPYFIGIDTLHRQAHELAVELCALRVRGQASVALERLDELRKLRDALLEALTGIFRETPS